MVVRPWVINPLVTLTYVRAVNGPTHLVQYYSNSHLQPVPQQYRIPGAFNGWLDFVESTWDDTYWDGPSPELETQQSLPETQGPPLDPSTGNPSVLSEGPLGISNFPQLLEVNWDLLTLEDLPETYSDYEDFIPG